MKISRISLFRWIAIGLVVIAAILLVLQLIQFSRIRAGFPPGTLIGGIAVGGLSQQQAADRVTQAYNNPIELVYKDQSIQVKPSQLGFGLNVESMIAAADQQRVRLPFWSSFWDYLWNRPTSSHDTPLSAKVDENRIRLFLMDEIASRYDEVPQSSQPIPGTINFQIGKPGVVLNIDKSLAVVEKALQSPFDRSAVLIIGEVEPPRPSLENLKILIKQILDRSNFDGITEVYVLDLENRGEINFAYELGVDYDPGIAFTAASTIKIPIMVSTFKRLNEPTSQAAADLITQMIEESENPPADLLMETYLDSNIGPILVTQDMQEIGLKNTFLGASMTKPNWLNRLPTPANLRSDYTTDPDPWNQTTTSDMGMLLDDLYQCAQTGGGSFAAVFQGEISQSECQLMITYLTNNEIAGLLKAGLPEDTKIAHKHGWVVEKDDGVIHSMIDAGIIFTSGGNYVAVVAMYQPTQLIYDVANFLYSQISTSIYNYFNIS